MDQSDIGQKRGESQKITPILKNNFICSFNLHNPYFKVSVQRLVLRNHANLQVDINVSLNLPYLFFVHFCS